MARKEQHDQLSAMAGLSPDGGVLPPNLAQKQIKPDCYRCAESECESCRPTRSDEAEEAIRWFKDQANDMHEKCAAIEMYLEDVREQLADALAQLAALQAATAPVGNYGDTEGTANPYWLIIDPHQMFKPDCHTVATMITGPFFSREAAQQHLDARRYAFGKHAVVYCHSAYWSKQYCALQDATRQPTQDKGE